MTYKSANFASSTLAVALSDVGTTLQVQTADKDKFPVIGAGETTRLVLGNAAGAREIIEVTARSAGSASMTIVRAVESVDGNPPVAQAWNSGDFVACRLTAGVVTQTYTHPSQSAGAHAASAISVTPAGSLAATDVQEALEELDSEKAPSGHAHTAGSISVTPTPDVDSTNVQSALAELGAEKAPKTGVGASGTWGINISGNAATADEADHAATADLAAVATSAVNGVPVGAIMDFAMSAPPPGWLECDGSELLRTAYPALDAAIGGVWGNYTNGSGGAGTTHFRLPDLRGYFRRSWGTNADGTASGAFAQKQADEIKQHAHTNNYAPVRVGDGNFQLGWGAAYTIQGNVATQNTGGAETRPKNIAVRTCIKT